MVSSALSVGSLILANAAEAASTCTWTAAGDGTSWSQSSNWSGCGGAPQNGDDLVFDTAVLGATSHPTNDISNLQVGSLAFTGTGMYPYHISGNPITLGSGITDNSQTGGSLNLDITLTANQTFTTHGLTDIESSTTGLTIGAYTLNVVNTGSGSGVGLYAHIIGTGAINFSSSGDNFINNNNPSYSGPITVNSGILIINASNTNQLGTGPLTIADGASLQESINSNGTYSIANPITVMGAGAGGAGAIIVHGYSSTGTVNFNGPETLAGDTQVGLTSANADFAGSVGGCGYGLGSVPGSSGTLSGNLAGSCVVASAGGNSTVPSAPSTGLGAPGSSEALVTTLALATLPIALLGAAYAYRRQSGWWS